MTILTKEQKIETFQIELDYLNSDISKNIAIQLLDMLPQYFWTVPASSSGKYHPSFALGEGGLVRHSKVAVKIAQDLLQLEQYGSVAKYHDEILIALMVHDGYKSGTAENMQTHTITEHPIVCAEQIRNAIPAIADSFTFELSDQAIKDRIYTGISILLDRIAELIESHMGQWNTTRDGQEVLPKPTSSMQQFVHLCDYLASRKWVTNEGFN